MPQLHPTRYFDATSNTLDYLLDEWTDSEDERETLEEAARLVAQAEGDIFDERSCPECGTVKRGTSDQDANRRMEKHRRAIHK